MNALILAPFSESALERLRDRVNVTYEPWAETKRLHNPQQLAERLRDEKVGIVIVEADFLVEAAFAVPSLRLAGACRNAVTQVDLKSATARGIPVLHAPARNNIAVAELAIALMLALARKVTGAHAYVSSGAWTNPIESYEEYRGREIAGSTVGIVGLGQIGREVAKRAQCLGAKVIAHDPYVTASKAKAAGARLLSLPSLLRRADFVTLHTAQIKEPIIDAKALDLIKPGAYLINTGAPGTLDYPALAERLAAGRIAGAGLDVFPGFVLAQDSPLMHLDNVVLIPHMGGGTLETVDRHSKMMTDDIERFLRGERPRRLANPDVVIEHGR
jgi:D-3-phosphoglycerate dehydrogenase